MGGGPDVSLLSRAPPPPPPPPAFFPQKLYEDCLAAGVIGAPPAEEE